MPALVLDGDHSQAVSETRASSIAVGPWATRRDDQRVTHAPSLESLVIVTEPSHTQVAVRMLHDVVDAALAERRTWGDRCDAWGLVESLGLQIVEELMPPGTAELPHLHRHAEQFFYVLSGQLSIEVSGMSQVVRSGQGLRVESGVAHVVRNPGPAPVRFLAIASPSTNGDREELPA